jgi:hypothetical protein
MRSLVFLVVTILSVAGCVSIPKTSSELVETSTNTRTYCYQMPPETVGARVEALLARCWYPVAMVIPVGDAYLPMHADFQVIDELLPDGNRYSVRNSMGFGYSADVIAGSPDCETEVRMYAVTAFWKRTFEAVDLAVKGKLAACPL